MRTTAALGLVVIAGGLAALRFEPPAPGLLAAPTAEAKAEAGLSLVLWLLSWSSIVLMALSIATTADRTRQLTTQLQDQRGRVREEATCRAELAQLDATLDQNRAAQARIARRFDDAEARRRRQLEAQEQAALRAEATEVRRPDRSAAHLATLTPLAEIGASAHQRICELPAALGQAGATLITLPCTVLVHLLEGAGWVRAAVKRLFSDHPAVFALARRPHPAEPAKPAWLLIPALMLWTGIFAGLGWLLTGCGRVADPDAWSINPRTTVTVVLYDTSSSFHLACGGKPCEDPGVLLPRLLQVDAALTGLPASYRWTIYAVGAGLDLTQLYETTPTPQAWPPRRPKEAKQAWLAQQLEALTPPELPTDGGSDYGMSLWRIGRILEASGAAEKHLYIVGDFRDQRLGPDGVTLQWDLARQVPDPDTYLSKLTESGSLPDLHGVKVWICGGEPRAVPAEGLAWSAEAQVRLDAIVDRLFAASGASLVARSDTCATHALLSPSNPASSLEDESP